MMFDAPELRVVLATVHIALADVPRALTRDLMVRTIALTARELPAVRLRSRRGLPWPGSTPTPASTA